MADTLPTPHYTRKGKLSAPELRAFRSRVSELKKQGLVSSKVNARNARPYSISGGKHLYELVNKSYEPPKPPKQKLLPANSLVSISNLTDEVPALKKRFKTLTGELDYLYEHSDDIEKFKRPEDYWTFSIHGSDSYEPYRDIHTLLNTLLKYRDDKWSSRSLQTRGDGQDILGHLKIMRFTGTTSKWLKTRKIRKPNGVEAKKRAARRRKHNAQKGVRSK